MSRLALSRTAHIGLAAVLAVALPATLSAQTLSVREAAEAALRSHPGIRAATARIRAEEAGTEQARAARLPTATVSAELERFEEPMIVAPLHEFDPTNRPRFDRTLLRGALTARYGLFDGGARASRIRAADASVHLARTDADDTAMAILERTVEAFFGLSTARAVRTAALAHVEAVAAEVDRAEQRLEAGTSAAVEVVRAEAARADARARLTTAEARAGLAERALARWMGVTAETVATAELTGTLTVALPDPASDLVAAPPTPDDASPTLRTARRRVQVAEAKAEEQRALRLPTLDLTGGLLDFGTLEGGHVVEWQAGLAVRWPLFTGGARAASVRRAEAEVQATRSAFDATALSHAATIDEAETATTAARARAGALASSVEQWQEVARIERLAVASGTGVQNDLLRAEAALFEARAGLAQARAEWVVGLTRLAHARGTLDMDWLTDTLEPR